VLGDGSVGKTSICHRFCNDVFPKSYKQTVGVDFFMKRVVLPGSNGLFLSSPLPYLSCHSLFDCKAKTFLSLRLSAFLSWSLSSPPLQAMFTSL
jgi:GTPase SAR1 family protein